MIYTWPRVDVYSPLETLFQGIGAVVARWCGLELRQFTIYQRMARAPQGI